VSATTLCGLGVDGALATTRSDLNTDKRPKQVTEIFSSHGFHQFGSPFKFLIRSFNVITAVLSVR
jgi:hypothetical protein